ncbi:glucosidase [Methylobacterium sp. 092160098-2]|nr:glucosidase [Methylobacterium sp. 092160098-2]MDE4915225.1 glucosidase [Methylobacterium sp. 092160098-2]
MPEASDVRHLLDTAEGRRLRSCATEGWHRWGPYLSERQWGTVREDYGADGTAWDYLPHDHARSRAYRWGEDGIAGFSDDKQLWCLSLALWNGHDPILKERMFGLTNAEGNHGEDVKELYWFLDGTPTHSYMRMLYKYPHAEFPYADLVAENGRRKGRDLPEYELADTGILAENRCFDITIEYAKAGPEDVLMRVTIINRGPEAAEIHILPHLCFRNTWSWREDPKRPLLRLTEGPVVEASRATGPKRLFTALQPAEFLFCENETNSERLFGTKGAFHPKDSINDDVIAGTRTHVNPLREGTKCAALSRHTLAPGELHVLRYRLNLADEPALGEAEFEKVFERRIVEADAFYAVLQHGMDSHDARLVQRQALAGMLWSKQFYHFDVRRWLMGDPTQPEPPASRLHGRNHEWAHLNNADIISMPDTWEYPWYAAWDLAFHCVTFALIDPEFAKGQLVLLTREWYMHPNGQLPAYEWNFGDVNPPVHAWAALRVYQLDAALTGQPDRGFLERVFHKLMLNFTWWVNRKDAQGRNVFQGGFLGLDNIGVFDRSSPLPTGGTIDQADGTAWMAMYTLNLMRIALELSTEDRVYEDIATKFFEHFLYIAEAMTDIGASGRGLWDEADQFFYDVLELPDGRKLPLQVRSLVGLIPLCAVEVLDVKLRDRFPGFARRANWMLRNRPDLAALVSHWSQGDGEGPPPGPNGDLLLLSLLRRHRMKALLARLLDETEFLSDHGIRALSKAHADHPFVLEWDSTRYAVDYEPAESKTGTFGGNSNWRGPIWMPINVLLIEALDRFGTFHGAETRFECPTGSGRYLSLPEIADELSRRICKLFLRGPDGRRPVHVSYGALANDPQVQDCIPFHEYFHGETGAGLGAMHQTGWTGLVALLFRPGRLNDLAMNHAIYS